MPDFMQGPLHTYMNVDNVLGGGQRRMSLEVQVVAHAHINAWAGTCAVQVSITWAITLYVLVLLGSFDGLF